MTARQEAKLLPSDGAPGRDFGRGTAIDGDTVLIGDPWGGGAAYVFTRSGSVWTERAKLVAGDALSGRFGENVALEGQTALVGAHYSRQLDEFSGAAYLFTGSGSEPSSTHVTVGGSQLTLAATTGESDRALGFGIRTVGTGQMLTLELTEEVSLENDDGSHTTGVVTLHVRLRR